MKIKNQKMISEIKFSKSRMNQSNGCTNDSDNDKIEAKHFNKRVEIIIL